MLSRKSPLNGKNILIATTGEITAATAVLRSLGVTLIEAYISEITEQDKILTRTINSSRLMQKIGVNLPVYRCSLGLSDPWFEQCLNSSSVMMEVTASRPVLSN